MIIDDRDYDKLLAVIRSVTTVKQMRAATNYIALWVNKQCRENNLVGGKGERLLWDFAHDITDIMIARVRRNY